MDGHASTHGRFFGVGRAEEGPLGGHKGSQLVDIDLRSLKNIRITQSKLVLRLVGLVALAAIAAAVFQVIDRDPSESAKIETVDRDTPDPAAIEEVGGDNLAAPQPLEVDGTLDTTGPDDHELSASDDALVTTSSIASAPDASTASSAQQDGNPSATDAPAEAGTPADSSGAAAGATTTAQSGATTSAATGSGSASDPSTATSAGGAPAATSPGSSTATTEAAGGSPTSTGTPTSTGGTTPGPADPAPPTGGQVTAAVIPFANDGVGDGATGGRAPWTPPRANLNFTDVADGNATTVAANCTSSNDCGAEIKRIINSNSTRPLKITFGDPSRRGASFNMRSPVVLKSDVYIEGINQPKLVVSSGSALFNVSGTSNVSIRNFDMDMQRCSGNSTAVVFAGSAVQNLFVSGINVTNAAPNADGFCENDFVRLNFNSGTAQNIHVYNNQIDRMRRLVRVQSALDTIQVLNNRVTEVGKEGYTQATEKTSRNVFIEGNVFSQHAPGAKAGHLIGFPLSTAANPQTYARNVSVRNNLVEGRPNTPHIRVEGQTGGTGLANGGAGDLIALRGIDGFILEGNMVRHSGEVGITATAGLKNGVIRYNQVSYTDTTGIVLGNEARNGNERVSNVDVYRNEMFQNSLDRAREFTDRDHPTFSLWNTVDSCIVNNFIHHNSNSNGFWVWNGNNATWPASVFDVYIDGNRFEANKRDFVEAPGQTPPYSVASPSGGENWTSFYDSAVDRDNDGLPSRCSSERNDNDPCVPDRFAEACRN